MTIGFFPPQVSPKDVNLKALVSNPTRIQRRLETINKNKYIVDYLFTQSNVNGGAIIYDRQEQDLYLDRDAEAIDDGAEFPKLTSEETEPQMDVVRRYGGEVDLTYASIRRNDTAAYRRKVQQLANTVLRKANRVAVAAVERDTHIPTHALGTGWDQAAGDPLGDLADVISMIDDAERGYTANTVLINPKDAVLLRKRKDIREALPREDRQLNPVLSRDLSGLMDLEWIKTPFVPQGSAWVTDRDTLGSFADEEGGLRADTYEEKNRHVHVLQAWRTFVPVVTDPYAAVKITGLSS